MNKFVNRLLSLISIEISIENGNMFAYRHQRERKFPYVQRKSCAQEHFCLKSLLSPILENIPLLLSALRAAPDSTSYCSPPQTRHTLIFNLYITDNQKRYKKIRESKSNRIYIVNQMYTLLINQNILLIFSFLGYEKKKFQNYDNLG